MGIRQQELKRIEMYAKSLGIKVLYKRQGPKDPEADWTLDGTEITVYLRNRQSTTQIILDIIHELGHHQHWIYSNRTIPISLDKALSKENKLTKKDREAIYQDEVNGAAYQLLIYKELGLLIPQWKVEVERDLQLEIYKYYYKNNDLPVAKWKSQKKKELILKYKGV